MSADFVGRSAELEGLRRAVDEAAAGSGSAVLLAGEPGIGKTRLAEELAAYAEHRGMASRWASGWEGDGVPAYWPWIQIIRAHAGHREPARLVDELGPFADEVVRLVPELTEQMPTLRQPSTDPIGEQPRFRLFDAVASFLRRASAVQPLLLVLDDLHWADVGTVMLLRFCGRELRGTRLLLLGTVRDLDVDASSELGRALSALQERTRTFHLGGLEPNAVRELLTQAVGHHEADRMTPDVHRRSGGNPLFVRELGRLLTATGRPGLGVAPAIPDSIRAVLDRRLSRLGADCLGLLGVAAVAGEEVRLEVLERVSGRPRQVILDLLDEAIRARLLREVDVSPPRFAFTHALIREALYNRLALAERADVHRCMGEILEQTSTGDRSFAELAHHFLSAGPAVHDARAVEYAELAGRQSFERLAYEDAAAHYSRALDALDAGERDDERRARLLLALGEARVWAADLPRAREAFEEAAELARRLGRPELLAEAALGFGAALGGFEVRLFDRAQLDLLSEAMDALGTTTSPLRARVMALLSVALTATESAEHRLRLSEDAIAAAREAGDSTALVQALGAHCDANSGPDHSEQRLTQATEMIRVAQQAGDRCMELLGRRHRLVALLETGDTAGVDAEIDGYAATAESVRQPVYLWYVPMWRAMRALMEGHVGEARELNEDVARIAARAHSENGALLSEVLRWNILRQEGRMSEAVEVMREQLKLTAGVPAESFWIGLLAGSEYPESAKAAVARLAPDDFAELPRDAIWLVGMSGVAEACAVVRDIAAAEKAYRITLPY